MLFGLSTFAVYMYIAASFDSLSLSEGKNWLLILPLLFILTALEIFAELKWGARNAAKCFFKGIRRSWIFIRRKSIQRKIDKQIPLSKRQLKFFNKYRKEKNVN